VRCIKPNPRNAPLELDTGYALEQLKWVARRRGGLDRRASWRSARPRALLGAEFAAGLPPIHPLKPHPSDPNPTPRATLHSSSRCGGIMEAVRISNAGYTLRRPFDEFLDTYGCLVPAVDAGRLKRERAAAASASSSDLAAGAAARAADRAAAEALLAALAAHPEAGGSLRQGQDWQIGKTMVFMRAAGAAALTRLHVRMQSAAVVKLQTAWRGHAARKEAAARRRAIVTLQAGARGMAARRVARAAREERAATALQAALRGAAARRELATQRAAAVMLQAALRARHARKHIRDYLQEQAILRYAAIWSAKATGAAAAMVRATKAVHGPSALRRAPSGGRDEGRARPRYRAAGRIAAAWKAARPAHAQYREEHELAAITIQTLWRDRRRLRSDARAARVRGALVDFAARWDGAVKVQAAWRGHKDRAVARALRDEKRKEAFKRNAAMFQGLAAAGGKPPMPSPLQAAFAIMATTKGEGGGEGGDNDVVKADATSKLEKRDLLEHRVGDLRSTAKVTSLLGIWQHRMSSKSKQAAAAAKAREHLVWQRHQQMLQQHMRKAHEQESIDLELEEPNSPDQGPPMLF
jgi:hypothetical protein